MKRLIWIFGVLFLLAIFLPGFSKLQELRAKNDALEQKIKELEESNQALIAERERLKTDIYYIEKVIREETGAAREGEIVYKIVPEEAAAEVE